ncbi:hypothetical protein DVH24_010372 [Malus domestica]|uniref:Uncharacterized protein n=1 Tax=Malus domestica TaxID=3750 RepID=A0A498JSX5_MALDO|nr:hypothetical protein DVH24_010372 [Malus domestica]
MTSKELNEKSYKVKISCTVSIEWHYGSKGDLSVNFSTITLKKQTLPYIKQRDVDLFRASPTRSSQTQCFWATIGNSLPSQKSLIEEFIVGLFDMKVVGKEMG